jgi:Spy/CpxP family protein refolding chaperone
MHRSRLLALTLAAGLVAAARSASAQTDQDSKPPLAADSARHMTDPISRMLEQRQQLKLTDDQVGRLEQVRTKYQEKNKARMEQLRRDRATWSALRASMDSARAEVAAVLTPEQEKQVEAMREQWRREWREGHRGRHGPHGRHHEHDEDDDSRDG